MYVYNALDVIVSAFDIVLYVSLFFILSLMFIEF